MTGTISRVPHKFEGGDFSSPSSPSLPPSLRPFLPFEIGSLCVCVHLPAPSLLSPGITNNYYSALINLKLLLVYRCFSISLTNTCTFGPAEAGSQRDKILPVSSPVFVSYHPHGQFHHFPGT